MEVLSPKRLQRADDKGDGIVARVRTNWNAEDGLGQFSRRREILALLCEKSHVLDLPFLAGKSAALLAVENDKILAVQDYFQRPF